MEVKVQKVKAEEDKVLQASVGQAEGPFVGRAEEASVEQMGWLEPCPFWLWLNPCPSLLSALLSLRLPSPWLLYAQPPYHLPPLHLPPK